MHGIAKVEEVRAAVESLGKVRFIASGKCEENAFAGSSYFAKDVFIATGIVFADEGPLNDYKARASLWMTAAAAAAVAPQL